MDSLPRIQLNDGNSMPLLAFGVGTSISGAWGNPEAVPELVKCALQAGYCHLDTAEEYKNEAQVGEGIRASGIARESIFITSKNLSEGGVTTEEALRKTLQNLGVEYVDLYLIHNVFFAKSDEDLQQKWREMEAVLEMGLTKSIGVSNIERQKIEVILKTARTPPAVNQIELHAYFQRRDLVLWLKQQNIAVACYSPLTPLRAGSPGPVDDIFQTLASRYNVSASEVGLRWCLDQGYITVTSTSKVQRLLSYANHIPSFKLTADEISQITALGKQKQFSSYWHFFSASGGDK